VFLTRQVGQRFLLKLNFNLDGLGSKEKPASCWLCYEE
jgi:hypothetical protein